MATLTVGYNKTYSTIASAIAAANAAGGDIIEVYKATATGLLEYQESLTFDRGLTLRGMDEGVTVLGWHSFTAANTAWTIEDMCWGDCLPTIGAIGSSTIRIERCAMRIYRRFLINDTGISGSITVTNSIITTYFHTADQTVFHIANCDSGFHLNIYNSALYSMGSYGCVRLLSTCEANIYNTVMIYASANFYTGATAGNYTYDYCLFPTANTGGNAGAHNQVANIEDMGLAITDGGGAETSVIDYRIMLASETAGTTNANGVDLTALYTTDIDGRSRTNYSIGCSEGYALYSAPAQSTAPSALVIEDNEDGVTWSVTATGQAAGAAILLYDHDGDELVAILDGSADTADLTAGQELYAKALEAEKTLSARYPAAEGVAVPELADKSSVDPGEENVKDGTAYMIDGEELEGTYDPTGAPPDAPTLSSVTAGDGTLTANVTAASESDTVYAIYREYPDGAWSAESEDLKRIGSGAIEIPSLTNRQRYQVAAYAKNGACTSAWSLPVAAAPTDGSEADLIELCEAVKDELEGNDFSSEFTATRDYVQFFNTEDVSGISVLVAPGGAIYNSQQGGMQNDQIDYRVNVGVMRKAANKSEADAVIALVQEFYELMRNRKLNGFRCVDRDWQVIYDEEAFERSRSFFSVLWLVFRGVK